MTQLKLLATAINDISPLRALVKLKRLGFYCRYASEGGKIRRSSLSDLTPLQGLSLIEFTCDSCDITDLSPLRRMPIYYLICSGTEVQDLSPLQGMPLKRLICLNSGVAERW